MLDRRHLLTSAAALVGLSAIAAGGAARAVTAAVNVTLISHFEVARFVDADSAELLHGRERRVVKRGEVFAGFTLMEVVAGAAPFVVLEDFTARDGHMLIVDKTGVRHDFTKTAEATIAAPANSFLGHSEAEVRASAVDLLGNQILSQPSDPTYEAVAGVFPPIREPLGEMHSFVNVPGKPRIAFRYGGVTEGFDPAAYLPLAQAAIDTGSVCDGLVGGYLPCLRFVYPEAKGGWSELLAFAPFDDAVDAPSVRYRLSHIEDGRLTSSRYVEAVAPAPARDSSDQKPFYAALADLKAGWDRLLAPGLKLDLPDTGLADQARHGIVRILMSAETADSARALRDWGLAEGAGGRQPAENPSSVILGLPQGTLSAAGYGYGLIDKDRIREALLTTYSGAAHRYGRGTWTAPETVNVFTGQAAGYSTAWQAFCPLMLRWLLVFEDPQAEVLWLGKGMPRKWFENEKIALIDDVPTRWGRISFATDFDRKREHRIAARIVFPANGIAAETRLRLRAHDQAPIRSVTVNGKSWRQFDAASETVILPAGIGGEVLINARY